MMSRWLTGCVLLAVVAFGRAQDEPATSTPPKKATKAEQAYKALLDEMVAKLRKTRAQTERQEIFDSYTEKLLGHARENPTDPSAVTALLQVSA